MKAKTFEIIITDGSNEAKFEVEGIMQLVDGVLQSLVLNPECMVSVRKKLGDA
jgi:hypothetical protein